MGVVVCGLALAGGAAFVALSPKFAVTDALSGATPSLAEARECLDQHNVACAEADYRAYLKRYPGDAKANAVLAILLTQDGQHQDAIPYYRHAAALGVATYDFHANYADSLDATGQTEAAIAENRAALKLVPSLADVRGALADQLVKRGRSKEALDLLEGFDRELQDKGQPPYFGDRIAQIRRRLGLPYVAEDAEAGAPAPAAAAAGAGSDVQLHARQGALYAPAVVDGALHLDFVVDSGASYVCITSDVAQALMRKGLLTRADQRGYGVAELADGTRVGAQLVVIHSIEVGGHTARNVLACVTRGQGSLLLGQSFLRRFKSWSVDNDRRVLVLKD